MDLRSATDNGFIAIMARVLVQFVTDKTAEQLSGLRCKLFMGNKIGHETCQPKSSFVRRQRAKLTDNFDSLKITKVGEIELEHTGIS